MIALGILSFVVCCILYFYMSSSSIEARKLSFAVKRHERELARVLRKLQREQQEHDRTACTHKTTPLSHFAQEDLPEVYRIKKPQKRLTFSPLQKKYDDLSYKRARFETECAFLRCFGQATASDLNAEFDVYAVTVYTMGKNGRRPRQLIYEAEVLDYKQLELIIKHRWRVTGKYEQPPVCVDEIRPRYSHWSDPQQDRNGIFNYVTEPGATFATRQLYERLAAP